MGIQNIRSTLPTRQPLHTELCYRSHSPKYACPHCCTVVKDEANVRRACSRVFFRASEVDDVMLRVGPKCDEGRGRFFFWSGIYYRRCAGGADTEERRKSWPLSRGKHRDNESCCLSLGMLLKRFVRNPNPVLRENSVGWTKGLAQDVSNPAKVLDARMYSWHPLFCPIPASPARVL